MLTLPLNGLSNDLRPTAAYGAAILHALARDEAAGRRPRRLTEPELATWTRFKHLLDPRHLLLIVAEDAAVTHPVPFDAQRFLRPRSLDELDDDLVEKWLEAIPDLELGADSVDYVQAQARLLEVPERMARSDLHKAHAHHKILELPGSGGQLCHFLAVRDGIYLQDNATIACKDERELALAGFIAVELQAPHTDFVHLDPELVVARDEPRRNSYDFVVGRPPEKGGPHRKERLHELFPKAEIVLV